MVATQIKHTPPVASSRQSVGAESPMDGIDPPPRQTGADPRKLHYPTHQVIGSFGGSTAAVIAALTVAGLPPQPTNILAGDADAGRMRDAIGGTGIGGLLHRVRLGLGANLDNIRRAERQLAAGRTLVGVVVDGTEAKERAVAILRQHGAFSVTHFANGTIETIS